MKKRIISGVVLAVLIIGLGFTGSYPLWMMCLLCSVIGYMELTAVLCRSASSKKKGIPPRWNARPDLIAMPGIPDGFRQVTLNFFVEGRLIDTIRVDYGGRVDESLLPAVPARSGYTGSWGDFDRSNIRFSRDIEAVYTLNHSTIAAEQTRGDSPLSIALLEGSFADDDTLTLAPYQGDAPSIPEHQAVETWELTLSGADGTETEYTVRYLPPEELQNQEVAIYCLKDGEWVPVETGQSGSYLTFPADSEQVIFSAVSAVAEQTLPTKWIAIAAGSGFCLLILLIILIRSHRKRKEAR